MSSEGFIAFLAMLAIATALTIEACYEHSAEIDRIWRAESAE